MKALKFLLLVLLLSHYGYAQKIEQQQLLKKISQHSQTIPVEKTYLSFDKPYYSAGDTIWFKTFLLNGENSLNRLSDRLYVELINDSSILIERRVIALNNGLGFGEFALEPTLRDGSYTVRAYTNWQQNFGSSYFFQQSFYIGNAGDKTWLVASDQRIFSERDKKFLDVSAKITNLKNEAAGYKDLDLYLMDNQKKLLHHEIKTAMDGSFNTKIPLPNDKQNKNLTLLITDKRDKLKKIILPLTPSDPEDIDVQFLPEGGQLVNGIYNRLAFKALGTNGLGENIEGEIVNNKGELITRFSTAHNGMGSFYLLPIKDETYFASLKIDGAVKKLALPKAKEEGTSLRIDHLSKTDSLVVAVTASPAYRFDNDYSLIAQAGDTVSLAVKINLKSGFFNLKLPKNIFPDGIIHFTLFSPDDRPLNERSAFLNRNKKITLKIEPTKKVYMLKDSISLDISATDEDGQPVKGSFAIAVTDDKQVIQPLDQGNIASFFLLQSNLKGYIENPSWYFSSTNANTGLALDNLLLTQGWIGYDWDEILSPPKKPSFIVEKENEVSGKLTNMFRKPMPNITLTLLSLGHNILVQDTLSNENGEFLFKNLPLIDSAAYTIKIKNQKGKVSNANIQVNEFEPPAPVDLVARSKPWYVNSDSTALKYFIQSKEKIKQDQVKLRLSGVSLKPVEIKAQSAKIMYEVAWDAKFILEIGDKELKKAPQKTLLDLLTEQIPGFRTSTSWYPSCYKGIGRFSFEEFVIGSNIIASIKIDNQNTFRAISGGTLRDWFELNNRIFTTLKAADVTGIRLYKGCVYYYLSITTRSGVGPWVVPTPGIYVYRPLPINTGKQFYSPKYSVKNTSTNDYRSTIFWDANVVTDGNGKATLSFYASDKASTYTLKVEGADLLGRFGTATAKLVIDNKATSK